jgi:hypothetical protein
MKKKTPSSSSLPAKARKRSPPRNKECECGNEATITKFGTRICKRCDDIDSNRPLDHLVGEEEAGLFIYKSSIMTPDEYLDEEFFI